MLNIFELRARQENRILERARRNKEQYNIMKLRRLIYPHFNNQCALCLGTNTLSLDHHVPFSSGGKLEPGNIVLLCKSCNSSKKDKHPSEFYKPEDLERITALALAFTGL